MFFTFPTKRFHVREISRELGISTTPVLNALKYLVKEGYLTREKGKVIDEIKANLDSKEFLLQKRMFNIESIYSSGLMEELIRQNPETVVLFGSYSRGEDTEKSDIDIALLGFGGKLKLEPFEKRLKRRINLHVIDLKSVSKEFKNSLANGIVLEGYLELL